MDLYHIHNLTGHNNCYYEGKVLHPGTSFNLMHEHFLNNYKPTICVSTKEKDGKQINYHIRLDNYIDIKLKRDNITKEELENLMITMRAYARNSSVDLRETVIEDVRKDYYSDRPSRYNCIWLTDEDGLDHWVGQLNTRNGYEIYKVEANGNLFASCDSLLPGIYLTHEEICKQAHKYWNPDSKYLENAKDKEYLFEGELKLVKKIK